MKTTMTILSRKNGGGSVTIQHGRRKLTGPASERELAFINGMMNLAFAQRACYGRSQTKGAAPMGLPRSRE